MLGAIAQYHADHPLEPGIPREELRERLFGEAPIVVFEEALRVLVDRRRIVARERVALTAHSVELTDEEARARAAIVQILDEAELTPPDIATLAARAGLQAEVVDRIAKLLVREKVLVRAGDLLFHEAAIRRLKTEVRSLKQTGEAATFDVAAFKDRYHVTRKYAIPLLELLDRERITRRVGETRHIL
jgi:selenocysteine-specific elongation factor